MSTDALRPSPESDADPATGPAGAGGRSDAAGPDDPPPPQTPRTGPGLPPVPAWLDEIEGAEALAWVEARNAETLSAYRGGERFESMRRSIEEILDSPDKIPGVALAAGRLYNFWTDADHPRGLWRRTTWESYRAGAPGADAAPDPDTGADSGSTQWEVLLDLDALGAAEGVPWVWHGASVLRTGPLAGRRALIDLSDGGSDTDVTREFDLDTLSFIDSADGGFHRGPSKGSAAWADDEGGTILMTADWGPGSLTASGYPRQVRRVRRGQDPAGAEIVLSAPEASTGVFAYRDRWGRTWVGEHPDFYTEELWLLPRDAAGLDASQSGALLARRGTTAAPGAVRVPVPASAQAVPAHDLLLIRLREPWEEAGTTHPAGALLTARLGDFLRGSARLETLFTPTASACLEDFTVTEHHIVLTELDDCVASLEVLTPPPPTGGPWARRRLDLSALAGRAGEAGEAGKAGRAGEAPRAQTRAPQDRIPRGTRAPQAPAPSDESLLRPGRALLAVASAAVDPRGDDRLWLTVSSFTRPTTLALGELGADGSLGRVEVLRRAPERFDAEGVVVTQHAAVSEDGTRVPYFQVGRPSAGPVATMLYGYGGFEVSLGVGYLPVVGKAWLERGGTFVMANIRGGGEYGPDWHRAGLRENRHRVYEDFAAVARALIERGVTTPAQLVVHGGSNGGLLVGNMLTGHPELVGAVVCEVPLLDMGRYIHLLAGASWRAEYGDPDDPAQWEFIRTFSPFHLLEPGRDYPPVLLVTSTRDDRVHPAHARTMAHRMAALGQDVTYFENSEGGHGRASTNAQRALMSALVHEFAWRRLAPGRPD